MSGEVVGLIVIIIFIFTIIIIIIIIIIILYYSHVFVLLENCCSGAKTACTYERDLSGLDIWPEKKKKKSKKERL